MIQEISSPPGSGKRPRIALVVGDPRGISPELMQQVLRDKSITDSCELVVCDGAACGAPSAEQFSCGPVAGMPEAEAGRVCVAAFEQGLALAQAGEVDGLCFMPFTKYAMRQARSTYVDEADFVRDFLGLAEGPTEVNIVDALWNIRVTSHIPLSRVGSTLTTDMVLQRIVAAHRLLQQAGVTPRIGVAGLNPHASDHGLFGSEEADVIAPAVERALSEGIDCSGPISPDTLFVRASRGEWNAVVSMYHDQGQIAMKLLGFDRGVVLFAGLPFPITTPAHGSAMDIAGQGLAKPESTFAAVRLAIQLAGKSHD